MIKKVHRIPYLGYHTRAYVFGDLNKGVPLIILHGGPGGCIERYEPLEKLADFGQLGWSMRKGSSLKLVKMLLCIFKPLTEV